MTSNRAGVYREHRTGYIYFDPAPLPPPDLELSACSWLASSSRSGVGPTERLRCCLILLRVYVGREAVLSTKSKVHASLNDVLFAEAELLQTDRRVPVEEVIRYIDALNHGVRRLEELPVSLRLIREIHSVLMRNVRGGQLNLTPGEFRRTQNWIGGTRPDNARFAPAELADAIHKWEEYVHDSPPSCCSSVRKMFVRCIQAASIHRTLERCSGTTVSPELPTRPIRQRARSSPWQ